MRSRAVPHPGFNFEYILWIFTRLSGLALVILSITGVIGAMILGARKELDLPALLRWSYFPNPNHVINSDIPELAPNWENIWWQTLEMVIVFFGVSHGMNGLRNVIEDYLSPSLWQTVLRWLVLILWVFFVVAGVLIVLSN